MTLEHEQRPWPWPAELDAVVAAPDFHHILYEDERVRVLEGRISPGVTVPLHTHRWPGVLYTISSSQFVRRDNEGRVVVDTRVSQTAPQEGSATWGLPLDAHTFENVGTGEFHTITVELKPSTPVPTGDDAPTA